MKRLFTLILILFCFAETKGQILWERIEEDTITYRDVYTKVMIKDSLILLKGIGYYNTPGSYYRSFYSCYNFKGTLKWRKNGRNIEGHASSFASGDVIIDNDSMLLTSRFNTNTFKLDWQHIRIANGDTLPANRVTVPSAFINIADGYLLKEPGGGYVIGSDGPWLSKMNSAGNPLWTKRHNWIIPGTPNSYVEANGFFRKSNGNYVMGGTKEKNFQGVGVYHPILVEFDPNGDSIKTRTFVLEHPQYREASWYANLLQTRKGDFLFTGLIDTVIGSCSGCKAKYYLAKADAQFNLKWVYKNKGVLKNYSLVRAVELADSSFAVLGRFGYTGLYAIIRVSKTGQYVSHRTYSNPSCNGGFHMFYDWQVLPDGTAIVAGRCKDFGYSYVARVGGAGLPAVSGNSKETETIKYSAEAYPNPSTGTVTFTYNLPAKVRTAEIKIREIATGKEVKTIALNPGEKQSQTSMATFKAGIYAYTLLADCLPVSTKKLIVVK